MPTATLFQATAKVGFLCAYIIANIKLVYIFYK